MSQSNTILYIILYNILIHITRSISIYFGSSTLVRGDRASKIMRYEIPARSVIQYRYCRVQLRLVKLLYDSHKSMPSRHQLPESSWHFCEYTRPSVQYQPAERKENPLCVLYTILASAGSRSFIFSIYYITL